MNHPNYAAQTYVSRTAIFLPSFFAFSITSWFLPPQVISLQQPVPTFKPVILFEPGSMRIDTCPSLGRRGPRKILMRPDMVVKETELAQRPVERIEGRDRKLIQTFFQRAEETFHPPVLPRTMQIGGLMADAQYKERKAKHTRSEYRLVVRSDEAWFAMAPD